MKIRDYNIHEFVTAVEYDKYKRSIDNARSFRDNELRQKEDRNMDCVYITGCSGSGKTTYAKKLAREKGYSLFVSSSSNDVLDGYQGQDCIILDDLRGSSFKFADLLKLLDNHTNSSVKSRYANKVLQCKMIIITSILTIDELYSGLAGDSDEPIIQLKRRCETYIDMSESDMGMYIYDRSNACYELITTIPNPVTMERLMENMSKQAKIDKLKALLGGMGDVLDKVDMIEDITQRNKSVF